MGDKLEQMISVIRKRISEGKYPSESAIREAIVVPLLAELGWDVLDPDAVIRELSLSGRRVDYGLSVHPPKPDIFIEVKKAGTTDSRERQLFEYAYHEGIPMAILTDGKEWHFCLPGEQGTYEERRVYKLDLLEREQAECVSRLERCLSFNRVRSGQSIEDARHDLKDAKKHKLARDSIPRAWQEIVREPDELLIELIAERAESICGYRPEIEDIEEFLIERLNPQEGGTREIPSRKAVRDDRPPSRKIEYRLFGRDHAAHDATDALINILRALSGRQSNFWERLEPLARGRKRNHLGRSSRDVYPLKPELEKYTMEIAPGWWLGTNIANRAKKRILEAACKVAGIAFGKDLKIDLPNTR